jgi:hypothetical protein
MASELLTRTYGSRYNAPPVCDSAPVVNTPVKPNFNLKFDSIPAEHFEEQRKRRMKSRESTCTAQTIQVEKGDLTTFREETQQSEEVKQVVRKS